MQNDSPFDPYKVFKGFLAPYWLLEHPGISGASKLCYIRLLGFVARTRAATRLLTGSHVVRAFPTGKRVTT
jgi:hypothetical protein